MMRARRLVLAAAVALAAGTAGYAFNAWWRAGSQTDAAAALMAAQLIDLQGKLLTIDRWRGRVLVVNFWATWCAPCREEIPMFVRLQERHGARGLQFIGVAIDQREKVDAFAREFGINYPVLIGGFEAVDLSRRAGNRLGGLPFTMIIDRTGQVASVHVGVVKETKLETLLQSLF